MTHNWQSPLPDRYSAMASDEIAHAIERRRSQLGDRLVILGHHYQADEVIRHTDFTGDSFKLSQLAADQVQRRGADCVVFCGVHFMAESADILTPEHVDVVLPDLSAGCSMADMADYDDVVDAWRDLHDALAQQGWKGRITPVTYMNSSAAIKAFVGEHGGAVCTSSNAKQIFEWAIAGGAHLQSTDESDVKVFFIPDQHLGRNTAAACGFDVRTQTCVYDPKLARQGALLGGATPEQALASNVILWAGHCSVHKLFRPEHCEQIRRDDPEARIIVHPECCKEVVDLSDLNGSTERIIRTIEDAQPGESWAIGTEVHLVNRLANKAAERGVKVRMLSDCQCLCTTMYRIDSRRLLWSLDNLAAGKVVNKIVVHPLARRWALDALNRMLELTTAQPAVHQEA